VEHAASTPVGMKVRCVARVTKVEGRKIGFAMEAWNEVEVIGRGRQERVVVELGRFVGKAVKKAT
jgi:fluoroacetyl-CoA thioesterase